MQTDPIKEWLATGRSCGPADVLTLVELGCRLRLAQLAEDKGQTVEAVASRPELLEAAGLPTTLPGGTIREAHRLNRNAIDGMLFRANAMPLTGRPLDQAPPELSMAEATALVEAPAIAVPTRPKPQSSAPKVRNEASVVQGAVIAVSPKPSRPAPPVKNLTPQASKTAKPTVHGFSACRVVMWCGSVGLGEAEAARLLEHHGMQLSSSAVRNNIKSAATGKMGQPAEFTADQAAQLTAIAKGA